MCYFVIFEVVTGRTPLLCYFLTKFVRLYPAEDFLGLFPSPFVCMMRPSDKTTSKLKNNFLSQTVKTNETKFFLYNPSRLLKWGSEYRAFDSRNNSNYRQMVVLIHRLWLIWMVIVMWLFWPFKFGLLLRSLLHKQAIGLLYMGVKQ